jgi:hypothetical protein
MTCDQMMGLGGAPGVLNVYSVPTRVWHDGDVAKLIQLRRDFDAARQSNKEL